MLDRLRNRGTVLGLLLLAGLGGLLASGQPWFSATGDAAPEGAITFSGAEATGGLTQALAAVVLAGVLLTLVLALRGRRVVAVLLGLAAVGMVVVGALRTPPSPAAVRTRFRQVSLADSFVLDGTGWPWLYLVAGLLAVAGAVLLWLAAPRWRRRSRRFERPDQSEPAARDEHRSEAADPGDAWRALDAGLDPTEDPGADPDVRSGGTTDTMVAGQDSSPRRQIGDQ